MKGFVFSPGIRYLVLLLKVLSSVSAQEPTLLPTSCREVVRSQATNPIECARVTRGDIGMLNDLELDPAWDTVAEVGTTPFNGYYDTILKQWVQSPHGGSSNNPLDSSGNKKLNPDELPGSCR